MGRVRHEGVEWDVWEPVPVPAPDLVVPEQKSTSDEPSVFNNLLPSEDEDEDEDDDEDIVDDHDVNKSDDMESSNYDKYKS